MPKRRFFRFGYCTPATRVGRGLRLHQLRDGDAFIELAAVLYEYGYEYGVDATHHGTFGNCQLFVRRQGVSLTNAPTRFHPEIAQAQDQAPYALSCGELMQAGAEQ